MFKGALSCLSNSVSVCVCVCGGVSETREAEEIRLDVFELQVIHSEI